MSLKRDLAKLVVDNFVAYFQAHAYHLNVVGDDFVQFHGLFEEVYDFLWESHDMLSEQQRQLNSFCDTSLKTFVQHTSMPLDNTATTAQRMLVDMANSLDELSMSAQKLYEQAGTEKCGGLETALGDYLKAINKLHWKLTASQDNEEL